MLKGQMVLSVIKIIMMPLNFHGVRASHPVSDDKMVSYEGKIIHQQKFPLGFSK